MFRSEDDFVETVVLSPPPCLGPRVELRASACIASDPQTVKFHSPADRHLHCPAINIAPLCMRVRQVLLWWRLALDS